MGQTLQLAGTKCMWKVFRRPKTRFWRQIIVFYQRWIWVMLIQGKCKLLFLESDYCFFSHKLRCYTGISGPEKSRNNTREKTSYFFTCVDIANQLLIRYSLWRHSVRLMNERQSPHDSQHKVVCRNFLGLWRLKHSKNPYRWKIVVIIL